MVVPFTIVSFELTIDDGDNEEEDGNEGKPTNSIYSKKKKFNEKKWV